MLNQLSKAECRKVLTERKPGVPELPETVTLSGKTWILAQVFLAADSKRFPSGHAASYLEGRSCHRCPTAAEGRAAEPETQPTETTEAVVSSVMGRDNRCGALEPGNSLRKKPPETVTDSRGEGQGLCLWFSSRTLPALVSSETSFTLNKWHAVSMRASGFSRRCTKEGALQLNIQ